MSEDGWWWWWWQRGNMKIRNFYRMEWNLSFSAANQQNIPPRPTSLGSSGTEQSALQNEFVTPKLCWKKLLLSSSLSLPSLCSLVEHVSCWCALFSQGRKVHTQDDDDDDDYAIHPAINCDSCPSPNDSHTRWAEDDYDDDGRGRFNDPESQRPFIKVPNEDNESCSITPSLLYAPNESPSSCLLLSSSCCCSSSPGPTIIIIHVHWSPK